MFKPVSFGVALLLSVPVVLRGQQGSPYVPLNDPVMPFVEHLIRSGVMTDPDPLTRPLKRSAVLAALRSVDTSGASANVRGMAREVESLLAPRVAPPAVGFEFGLGMSAGTHSRRDPLREAGPHFAGALAEMRIWTAMGPLVLSSHPVFNQRVRHDPDYPGPRDRPFPLRFEDAYASIQPRYAEITFGAVDRNWGPTGIDGLIVSAEPYTYDHLYLRLGIPAFRVESELAQLNDALNSFGVLEHRWWVAHRFVFKPWPWMTAVLGQAALWKGAGPAEQSWYLNPTRLSVYTRESDALVDSANVLLSGDLWIRLPSGTVFQAQALIDDLSMTGHKTAPNRLAGTMLVDVPISRTASVRGLWTLVSSLAYRTFEGPIMSIVRHDVGLGRNFDDYSQWTISGSVAPHPRVLLTPEVTLLLQGEGDIRKPMPPYPAFTYPFLLVGTTERTLRLGMGGRARGWHGLDISANAGVHFIANRQNVSGASATRFVGTLGLAYRFGGEYRAP